MAYGQRALTTLSVVSSSGDTCLDFCWAFRKTQEPSWKETSLPLPMSQHHHTPTPGVYLQPPTGYITPGMCTQPQQISVVMEQPGRKKKGRPEKWDVGLYGCLDDISTTCAVLFCAPCYLFYLATMMDESCCLPLAVPMALMALRLKLRLKNNIEGSIIGDCCTTSMCPLCAMCQLKRQFDRSKE
ncbi:hypothetical protein LSAT2_023672 [Lamellibrachia satsuma]|nr:hypothetical protein LSAT2_023672 [Lamellibrachia satsuma]